MNTQQMMVKITAPLTEQRQTAGLDMVVVLDVSKSMAGKKLQDMKAAMKFLIKKLGTSDRLAIVPFSSSVHRRYPDYSLIAMTGQREKDMAIDEIQGLRAGGDTNIKDGLMAGINILVEERREMAKRASCIFLMSDGFENINQARSLFDAVAGVTVHTFGFGIKSNAKLLFDIASRSHIGIYHYVQEKEKANDLMESFVTLAIFRSISMLGLEVTLSPNTETENIVILRVDPGCYTVTPNDNRSYTIHFGDLAREENRRILVDVQLPTVHQNQKAKNVLKVEYSYSAPLHLSGAGPTLNVQVDRVQNPGSAAMNRDVRREVVRRGQAEHLRKVMDLANDRHVDQAMVEVDRARNDLNTIGNDRDDAVAELFKELDNLHAFLRTYDTYNDLGRSYLLACISSHERQRYAARGGTLHIGFYLTNRMTKYLDQARKFHTNPNIRI